jgi:hypothetical protein
MGVFFPPILVSVFARIGRGGHDIITLGCRHRLVIDIIVGIRQWGVNKTHCLRSRVVTYLSQAWTRYGDTSHQQGESCQENEDSSGSVHDLSPFGVIILILFTGANSGNRSPSGIRLCCGLPVAHPEDPNRAGAGRCPAAPLGNTPGPAADSQGFANARRLLRLPHPQPYRASRR